MTEQERYWIAVASAEHVRRGRAEGFMQVSHGKGGPLTRIRPGDGIACYSPSTFYGKPDGLQSFTAIGRVADREPHAFDMGGGFVPVRRDVAWYPSREAPIRPLLDALDLTRGKRNWGAVFRFGVVQIGEADFAAIAQAMEADAR